MVGDLQDATRRASKHTTTEQRVLTLYADVRALAKQTGVHLPGTM
ncbi:MAG TPA: hypothetical protein VJP80_05395 [Candidatus Saccharimonadales bacterium]|nr:hypothetical protein [Candidatus Saccharimonadales bacterium]